MNSTSKCTTESVLNNFEWCSVAEALARPIIERVNDEGKLMIGYLLERHMHIEDTGRMQRKHV